MILLDEVVEAEREKKLGILVRETRIGFLSVGFEGFARRGFKKGPEEFSGEIPNLGFVLLLLLLLSL